MTDTERAISEAKVIVDEVVRSTSSKTTKCAFRLGLVIVALLAIIATGKTRAPKEK